MFVLLVKPIADSHLISPPLGLGYLATAIRKSHEVEILDCIRDMMTDKKFEAKVMFKKPDVVGFQVCSRDLPQVEKSIRMIKKISPLTVVIVGGPHPSSLPHQTMHDLGLADYGFQGEGEIGLPLLLRHLSGSEEISLTEIPGLLWREKGKVNCNPPIFIESLNSLGFPSWDLIQPQRYPRAAVQGAFVKNFPVASIITTRGCPYRCTYCAGPLIFGRKVRARSIDHIFQEIELLYFEYGIKEIQIVDDHFIFNLEFAKDFCRRAIEKNLNLTFYGVSGVRIEKMDRELLELMKKAKFYQVAVGVESGSDRVLKLIKKNLTINVVREKIKLITEVGLEVIAFFIIGFPGETREEIIETIKFACELPLKRATFSSCLPLPGTEIYYQLKKEGKLRNLDWTRLHFSKICFPIEGVTTFELAMLQRYAFLKFMFRPKIIWKHLQEIKSLSQILFLAKRFRDYILCKH